MWLVFVVGVDEFLLHKKSSYAIRLGNTVSHECILKHLVVVGEVLLQYIGGNILGGA